MDNHILSAEVEKNRVIAHKMADGTVNRYAAVRGGVAWAIPSAPAYYCIFGQEYIQGTAYKDVPRKDGKLVLLAEHQSDSIVSQSAFIRRLTDDAKSTWCCPWYAAGCEGLDQDPDAEAFRQATSGMVDPSISLQSAPWVEKFATGFGLIAEFREAARLKIPADSIVYKEIVGIGEAELRDNPAGRFNALNALRYVLASFKKTAPSNGATYTPTRRGRARRNY